MESSVEEMARLLGRIRGARVAVLGDFCLDAYLFLDDEPSSVGGGVREPIQAIRGQRYCPGGAANVSANCATLGPAQVHALGVVGRDLYGATLARLLAEQGVNTEGLITQSVDWHTRVHTRFIQNGAHMGRLDFGNHNVLAARSGTRLLERLEDLLPVVDVVVINQQLVSGVHTPAFRIGLRQLMLRSRNTLFVVDSRHHPDEYPGAIRKLNGHEACLHCGIAVALPRPVPLEAALRSAAALHRRWRVPVVVTRGEEGDLVADGESVRAHPAVPVRGPVDTVGAGDSYLAGFATALGAGAEIDGATRLGSHVAAVTVRKVHTTGTACAEEVLAVAAAAPCVEVSRGPDGGVAASRARNGIPLAVLTSANRLARPGCRA